MKSGLYLTIQNESKIVLFVMLLPYTTWQYFCTYPMTVTPLPSVVNYALHAAKSEVLTNCML